MLDDLEDLEQRQWTVSLYEIVVIMGAVLGSQTKAMQKRWSFSDGATGRNKGNYNCYYSYVGTKEM